ncbi:hypothetical protein J4466_01120 [Candidatus Pacearchaeota archaeon]|nr:hypothetical protein [Candidatus Pacearchaeota archaeon]
MKNKILSFENEENYDLINSRRNIDLVNKIIDENKDLIIKMKGNSSSASIVVNFNVNNGMIQYQTEAIS